MNVGDKVHVIEQQKLTISNDNYELFDVGPELIGTILEIGERYAYVSFPIVPGLSFRATVEQSNLTRNL
jgi:hypothetical protein